MDVSCSASAAAELGVRFWETGLEERGGAASCGAVAGLGSSKSVSGATTAAVDEFAWLWVWLGDLILRRHCGSGFFVTWRGGLCNSGKYVLFDENQRGVWTNVVKD
jgi:hypothetical protein